MEVSLKSKLAPSCKHRLHTAKQAWLQRSFDPRALASLFMAEAGLEGARAGGDDSSARRRLLHNG